MQLGISTIALHLMSVTFIEWIVHYSLNGTAWAVFLNVHEAFHKSLVFSVKTSIKVPLTSHIIAFLLNGWFISKIYDKVSTGVWMNIYIIWCSITLKEMLKLLHIIEYILKTWVKAMSPFCILLCLYSWWFGRVTNDYRRVTYCVFVDFSKAFDMVNRHILCVIRPWKVFGLVV